MKNKETNKKKKSNKGVNKKELAEKKQKQWLIIVTISTFISTVFITYISDVLLSNTPILLSLLLLIFIIIFGVTSDIVGVAITAVKPQPFNAMASKKIFGAKTAVWLIKNAARFSNICNDVVGDICGIVSGAIGVSVTAQFMSIYPFLNAVVLSLVMSGLIASFTVAGKAFGKEFALKNSIKIITLVSKIIETIKSIFGLNK